MKGTNSDTIPYQEYFGKEHNLLRSAVRDFVKKEIIPFIDEWEEAGEYPIELYPKMAELGFLGIGYPEDVGGTPGDNFLRIAYTEEMMRAGSGGLVASIGTMDIAIPPIARHGTPEPGRSCRI